MSATENLYSQDVDYDKMTVDELVQRLEAMEKNNEQIKRENQLFESYILRKQKEDKATPEEMNQKYRSLKAKYGEKALMLTPEKKYDIASLELSTLKANIDEGRTKSETLLERKSVAIQKILAIHVCTQETRRAQQTTRSCTRPQYMTQVLGFCQMYDHTTN